MGFVNYVAELACFLCNKDEHQGPDKATEHESSYEAW